MHLTDPPRGLASKAGTLCAGNFFRKSGRRGVAMCSPVASGTESVPSTISFPESESPGLHFQCFIALKLERLLLIDP